MSCLTCTMFCVVTITISMLVAMKVISKRSMLRFLKQKYYFSLISCVFALILSLISLVSVLSSILKYLMVILNVYWWNSIPDVYLLNVSSYAHYSSVIGVLVMFFSIISYLHLKQSITRELIKQNRLWEA